MSFLVLSFSWGLIKTNWLRQLTEQKGKDPFLFMFEVRT